MNVRRQTRLRLVFGAVLAVASLCMLVSGAAAASLASGTFQAGSVGETVSIPIVLDSAPEGLSGYRITVSLGTPSVATITGATFPDWASLKSSSGIPSGQVVLQAVDLSQQVPLGATGVLIATLTVKSTATGSTSIVITPDPSMGVENRAGNLYPISASPGTLTVGTPSSGGATTPVPTVVVPTPAQSPGAPTPVTTVVVPTAIQTGGVPVPVIPTPGVAGITPIPTSTPDDSAPVPVYPVVPVTTTVPGVISPANPSSITTPVGSTPRVQPTFSVGKRYAVGNPGSFIGTRFGSGGTPTGTGTRGVTTIEPTLKPGSRAYGLKPPAGKFIRWYPAERWKAGIK